MAAPNGLASRAPIIRRSGLLHPGLRGVRGYDVRGNLPAAWRFERQPMNISRSHNRDEAAPRLARAMMFAAPDTCSRPASLRGFTMSNWLDLADPPQLRGRDPGLSGATRLFRLS